MRDERTKFCGITDLAQGLEAGDRGLEVVGVGQCVRFDPNRVGRIRARQPQLTPAFGVRRGAEQNPAVLWQTIFRDILGSGLRKWPQTREQVRPLDVGRPGVPEQRRPYLSAALYVLG